MLVCFVSSPAFSEDIVSHSVYAGQLKTFAVYPNQLNEVIFQPWQTGTWTFTSWHSSLIGWNEFIPVAFYWKDANNPNDDWHHYRDSAIGYNIYTQQTLYNGSSGITHKFEFIHYGSSGLTVNIDIQ